MTHTLCKPDHHGNYYLGGGAKYVPAIFKGGSEIVHKDGTRVLIRRPGDLNERWFLSLKDGVVFYHNDIRYFPTPQLALSYLNEMEKVNA